jgi:hypothetical protein
MKYEAPQLSTLTPAIDAIQVSKIGCCGDGSQDREPPAPAYEDGED